MNAPAAPTPGPTSRPILHDMVRRLRANVEAGLPDMVDTEMKVPASSYADASMFERELDDIFRKVPLMVALSADIRQPGEYLSYRIAGRPIIVVRGDDGRARTLLNVCRHRGARLTEQHCGRARTFICPYHSWTYDRQGSLVGITGPETFGEVGVNGLIELPTEERHGLVFASLDEDATLDLDAWLGDMAPSLAELHLEDMHPYRKETVLDSPNWKLAADGYVDGYHIGYLHKDSIGKRSITNRNTYDCFGPHVRVGFASKLTTSSADVPEDQWYLPDYYSVVHYLFPNVSISGGHGETVMVSKLLPGPTVDRSETVQFQYYRQPVEGDQVAVAEEKRKLYEAVVRDEDCAVIFGINDGLEAMGDGHVLFGRNEGANQNLHRSIAGFVRK